MALSAKKLMDSNGRFYDSGGDPLFSNTYSASLSWRVRFCNTIGSILYLCFSAAAALYVKKEFQVYAFIRQASRENLEGTEVLTWAQSQADSAAWDPYAVGILLLGLALIITQVVIKFFIKKYIVYKLERRILLLTFLLTFLQLMLAWCGSILPLASSFPVAWPIVIALVVLLVVFLLGIFAAKLPYPLEFKQYEDLMEFLKFTNFVAALIQKFILH